MDKIYPAKQTVLAPPTLTPEEVLSLKKGLVLAIEKDIVHPQDRALDALAASNLKPEVKAQVHAHLSIVADLEAGVRAEGARLRAEAEKAYEKGTTDVFGLVPKVQSELIDPVIWAKRFVEVKEDSDDLTPIFEEKVIVEPDPEPILEEGEEEIIKDPDDPSLIDNEETIKP